jgi:hypothetical protein
MKMKKTALSLLLASGVAFGATSAQAVEPSRLFSMETAEVSKEVSVDLDYMVATLPLSNGFTGALRIGAFGGEVLVNTKNTNDLAFSGFLGTNAGFKKPLGRNLAVYGILSYDKPEGSPATTDFAIGAAYTLRQGNLVLTINPELVTDDGGFNGRGEENTLFIKAGAAFALPSTSAGKFTLIGEIIAENSDFLDTGFNVGVRWEPRRNVTLDLVFLREFGDLGSSTGFPGAVRLNVAF